MKEHLYSRLWEILSGKDQSATYALLGSATRHAIREILTETKRDIPDYWKRGSGTPGATVHGTTKR